jgi:hypothetical protein
MPGFFQDIRRYFQADFSGRYLSLVLRELARKEPASFACILEYCGKSGKLPLLKQIAKDLRNEKVETDCEMPFEGSTGNRRADITLKRNGNVLVHFELKEDDWKNVRNKKQLADYLLQVTQRHVPLIHLTRFSPDPAERKLMDREIKRGHQVMSMRYRDLYAALETADGPLAQMVRDYLEDIGVATYQTIDLDADGKSVAFLLVKTLGFRHAHGKGRLKSERAVSELPRILQKVFGNLQFLADIVKERNSGTINTRFNMDFRPRPKFHLAKLGKALTKRESNDEIDVLPGEFGQYVDSGSVEFSASGSIHSALGAKKKLERDGWLYVELGYEFEISTGRDAELIKPYIWAGFWGRGLEETWTRRKCSAFPTESQALGLVHDCLKRFLAKAQPKVSGAFREALRAFRLL